MIGLYEKLCIIIGVMKINIGNDWNNHGIWILTSEYLNI
jgi:hypothetical protein